MDHKIVVENSAYFRAEARTALKGNWVIAAVAMGIYFIIIGIINFVVSVFVPGKGPEFVAWIYSWIVMGPALVGLYAFLLKLKRRESNSLMNVFYGFERFGTAFFLGFLITLFTALWTLLLIIPGIVAAYRYSLAPAIMLDNPQMSATECINESKRLMMGNKMSMFVMDLSFIGWILLASIPYSVCSTLIEMDNMEGVVYVFALLIAKLPILWATVYVSMANMAFYEDIIKPFAGQNNNSGYQYQRYDGYSNGGNDGYQRYDGQNNGSGHQYQRYDDPRSGDNDGYQRYEGQNDGSRYQYQRYEGPFGGAAAQNNEGMNSDGSNGNGAKEGNGVDPVGWENGNKK